MKNLIKTKIAIIILFIAIVVSAQDKYHEVGLTEEEIIYLNENIDVKKDIDEYIAKSKPLNEDNIRFVKDLVSLLTQSNYKPTVYTEENYPGKEDGLPFEWWKEPKKFNFYIRH